MREAFEEQRDDLAMGERERAYGCKEPIAALLSLVGDHRVLARRRDDVILVLAQVERRLPSLREESERPVVSDAENERLLATVAAKPG